MSITHCTTDEIAQAFAAINKDEFKSCRKKAEDYFYNKKKHNIGYNVTGTDTHAPEDDIDDYDGWYFIFSDEDVVKIKQLLVDTYNKLFNEDHVTNYKEFEEALDRENMRLDEFRGANPELDKIFFYNFDGELQSIKSINWEKSRYQYKISIHGYYQKENKYPVIHTYINLTDEEYILLLTKQLYNRYFTFNDLLYSKETRKLATEIHNNFCGIFYDYFNNEAIFPYLIVLDEVVDDATEIDGPTCMDETLFDAGNNMENEICARIEKREFLVFRNYNHCNGFAGIEGVSADDVMKCLGKDNYEDTLKELKARYNTKTAFDDIKRLLTENKIKFKETK